MLNSQLKLLREASLRWPVVHPLGNFTRGSLGARRGGAYQLEIAAAGRQLTNGKPYYLFYSCCHLLLGRHEPCIGSEQERTGAAGQEQFKSPEGLFCKGEASIFLDELTDNRITMGSIRCY